VIYLVPANPTSPPVSLPSLRRRAKSVGYRIARDRYGETFSLIDARLRIPLLGLDHVGLPEIAHAIQAARHQQTLQT
jgi:hypothetical protein